MVSKRYDIDEMPEVFIDDDRLAVRFSTGRIHVWKPHRFRNFVMLAQKVLADWDKANGRNVSVLPGAAPIVHVKGESC